MLNLKNLLNPAALLAAALTILVFLPDLDSFASSFSTTPQLVSLLSHSFDENRFQGTYGKLVCLLLFCLCVASFSKWQQNPRLKLFLLGSMVLVMYGWLLLAMAGVPLGTLLRTSSLVGLYLMIMAALVCCGFANNPRVSAGIVYGILGAGGLRLIYATYCYRRYGGVQIFEGTPAIAMDGGLLILWVVIAVWAAIQTLEYFVRSRLWGSFLMLLTAAVFSAALAASYRRTVMLLLIGTLALATVFYSWFRNRLTTGLIWVGGMSIVMLAGLFLVMVMVFGFTSASERVFSLGTVGDGSSFSNSNAVYLEDQAALKEIVLSSSFLGVGPGMPYGIRRISDDFTNEGIVPLHTGTTELWASEGLVGIIYHLAILLALPAVCLRAYHRNPAGGERTLVAVAASYVISLNLWPFAPPYYENVQGSVLLGLCLGYLIHAANGAGFRAQNVREVASPERAHAPRLRA